MYILNTHLCLVIAKGVDIVVKMAPYKDNASIIVHVLTADFTSRTRTSTQALRRLRGHLATI